ncbi:MAG: MaoC/PaaZ C-terminal domain-containing protein [Pseudohongiellaceae bacterium]
MAIDPDYLLRREFPMVRQTYDEKDCMLYALGVGMGMEPEDERVLRFVFEEDLKVVPSQAVMLAHPGFWANEPDLNIDWPKILHSEQEIVFHHPLPAAATVEAANRIIQCIDKGERLGALIVTERTVRDVESGADLCTLITTILARGDGGFGGERKATPKQNNVPTRAPDKVCDLETMPQQALLYRLTGDFNPLHASPAVARSVGFERPILHGLCTMGVVTHALLRSCCDYDPARFKRLQLRFSAPVYPGETIRTEIWEEGDNVVAFRARSVEQDKVIINNGRLEMRD